MINSLGQITNPSLEIQAIRDSEATSCLYFEYDHCDTYTGEGNTERLGILCLGSRHLLQTAFTSEPQKLRQTLEAISTGDPGEAYLTLVDSLNLSSVDMTLPLMLDPVHIAKPWGQEVWYTGIEQRGVCTVQGTPLPWILDVFQHIVVGDVDLTPVLLKILDPHPDEVYGDLYFEAHAAKREIYVVTHIDKIAWPDGYGEIRYGFSPEKMAAYDDDAAFKKAYLSAVNDYQVIRKEIDRQLDLQRKRHQYLPEQVVPVSELQAWHRHISSELIQREQQLRLTMHTFTSVRALKTGDVVQVQPHTPHALQHGVRVIEFQTPHYERYILSFAQKVLTQDGWDTEKALETIILAPEDLPAQMPDDCRIADFEEFCVDRFVMAPGSTRTVLAHCYSLLIGVHGRSCINGVMLPAESACYVPLSAGEIHIVNPGNDPAILLLATPGSRL